MRDFFAQQHAARRNTYWLIVYFSMAVTVIVGLVTVAVYVLTTFNTGRLYTSVTPFNLSPRTWDFAVMGKIALVVLVLILLGTLYKYLRLRAGGGSLIAQLLGGRIVFPDSNDLYERRLLNIVEEMAIASGVTVPSVYLLERESGINAFAAGFSQEDAVLGISRGALYYLNREELQGVVAHEFSHILYGDMLLNVRLQGILHGILVIGLLGEVMLKSAFASDRPGSRAGQVQGRGGGIYLAVMGLVLLVFGYAGVFIARLIKSAVARQREFLADASAVQFTRNPAGLANALKKIGGFSAGATIRNPHAAEISHMFFGNSMAKSWFSAFSTHPPLIARIQRLEPGFAGDFPMEVKVAPISEEEAISYAAPAGAGSGRTTVRPSGAGGGARHVFIHSLAAGRALREAVSGPDREHLRVAREMLASFPSLLLAAARNPFGARAVVYGLLLDTETGIRARQMALLEQEADPQVWKEVQKLLPAIAGLLPETRLPLLDLCMPALKNLSEKQYGVFRRKVGLIMKIDGKIDLFEYALQHVLLKRLKAHFEQSRERILAIHSLARAGEEISCVLSLLARLGHGDEGEAQRAVMKASRVFGKEMKRVGYLAARSCTLKGFDRALSVLAGASLAIRRQVLAAALECIVADETVTIREAELFRTIAEALNCPAPPWLTLKEQGEATVSWPVPPP